MNYLLSNNRTEDAKKATEDKDYRNKLLSEILRRNDSRIAHAVKFISMCQLYHSAFWAVGCWLSYSARNPCVNRRCHQRCPIRQEWTRFMGDHGQQAFSPGLCLSFLRAAI